MAHNKMPSFLDILAVGMQNEENAGIFKEENQAMVDLFCIME